MLKLIVREVITMLTHGLRHRTVRGGIRALKKVERIAMGSSAICVRLVMTISVISFVVTPDHCVLIIVICGYKL